MTIVVEDGTGLPNAVSYVSMDDADAYHLARSNMDWLAGDTCLKSASLVRATFYIDATYRSRFPGYRTNRRAQALEWPRTGAYTYVPDDGRSNGYVLNNRDGGYYGYYDLGYTYLLPNEIPREIVAATCEAALREIIAIGTLSPDVESGGPIRSVKAGSVEVVYNGTSPSVTTQFRSIDLALVSLLMPSNTLTGRAVR